MDAEQSAKLVVEIGEKIASKEYGTIVVEADTLDMSIIYALLPELCLAVLYNVDDNTLVFYGKENHVTSRLYNSEGEVVRQSCNRGVD